jgi:hypothetical protein
MRTLASDEHGLVTGIRNRLHLAVKFCCPRWRLTMFLQGPPGFQCACFEYLALYILRTRCPRLSFLDLQGGYEQACDAYETIDQTDIRK